MRKKIVLLSCLILLSGCASVLVGESQDIAVDTDPEGAACTLARNGAALGEISSTPGVLHVEKTKDDISIHCRKAGYRDADYVNESGHPDYNWLYILIGGPVGWSYDSATGSDNEYASPVTLYLAKKKKHSPAAQ